MRRANAAHKSPQPRSADPAYTREIFTSLVRILLMSGETRETLIREFAQVCRTTTAPPLSPAQALSPELDYAHVISHWYSRPEYVDTNGLPRPLPLTGRGPSLTRLIDHVLPHARPAVVLESLEKLGAVREESGWYRPTGQYVSFGQQHEDAMRWLLTVLRGVLHAIEHNASSEPADRIPGRAAINPRFPVSAVASFYARLREHIAEFLWNADLDMHLKEAKTPDEPTTQLGVVVLGFEDPLVTGRGEPRPRSRKRRPRKPPARRGNRR